MESLKKEASKVVNEVKDKNGERDISNWSDVVGDIVDKLTGKDMEVTYNFDNLEVDIPKATGPEGKELGSAKWKINGKITVTTETYQKGSGSQP